MNTYIRDLISQHSDNALRAAVIALGIAPFGLAIAYVLDGWVN